MPDHSNCCLLGAAFISHSSLSSSFTESKILKFSSLPLANSTAADLQATCQPSFPGQQLCQSSASHSKFRPASQVKLSTGGLTSFHLASKPNESASWLRSRRCSKIFLKSNLDWKIFPQQSSGRGFTRQFLKDTFSSMYPRDRHSGNGRGRRVAVITPSSGEGSQQASMQRGALEAVLIGGIASWAGITLLMPSGGAWHPSALALLGIGGAALAVEGLGFSRVLYAFHPRSGASPGVALGVLTLPLLYAAKLVQELRVQGVGSGHLTRLTLWVVLACGAGMVGSVMATWHHVHNSMQRQLRITGPDVSSSQLNGTARGSQAGHISGTRENGEHHSHASHDAEGKLAGWEEDGEKEEKLRVGDKGASWPMLIGWVASSLGVVVAAVYMDSWLGYGGPAVVGAWLAAHTLTCGALLLFTLKTFPGSATPGEALLVAEGLTLYGLDALGRTVAKVAPGIPLPPHCSRGLAGTGDEIDAIVQSMVLGVLLQPLLWSALSRSVAALSGASKSAAKRDPRDKCQVATFYVALLTVVLWLVPAWLRHIVGLQRHPLLWAVEHILEHARARLALCCYWLLVLLLPLRRLRRMATEPQVAHILVRKYYHLMAVAMFVPALALQAGFLRLAFGVALAAFLILEILRVARVPPFGPAIDAFLRAFLDSRDSGALIISHFSLLLGCALPLWVSGRSADRALAPFAGIISLGVGDTMASVVGYQYGRLRITRDSKKTVEGTAAGILSMLLACAMLAPFLPHAPVSPVQWTGVAMATTAAGLLEAYTTQLDNAFVPLVYYALLCL